MVGETIGHYEILEPLGAGGMGEVYLARDKELDRDVAIKALPEEILDDGLQRFEREAKLLASLNHANIATVYGLVRADDRPYLVMELLEGESLAERLKRGALPVEQALGLARQIATALEAAHQRGIIHRDLKPANIQVLPDGTAKVLDFGIAKVSVSDDQTGMDISDSPTVTVEATRAGVILGRAPYMSPEQARGKPLDKHTDIWSL